MPLSEMLIGEIVDRYWREHDRYQKLAETVADIARDLVTGNVVRASVQWRAKDRESLRRKLRTKYAADVNLNTADDVFRRVGDLAGVRVTTYVETDRAKVVEQIRSAFAGPDNTEAPQIEEKDKHSPDSYYRATHCQVALPQDRLIGRYANLQGLSCELQVCSMLAHVWNEIEHDLLYKPQNGVASEGETRLVKTLGEQMLAGDGVLAQLLAETQRRLEQTQGEFVDEYDFVARMRTRFPDAKEFGLHARQLFEELLLLGFHSPDQVDETLLGCNFRARAAELVEAYNTKEGANGLTLILDSSDTLLVLLLDQQADQVLANHPAGPGMGRPPRIASVARRFKQYQQAGSLPPRPNP